MRVRPSTNTLHTRFRIRLLCCPSRARRARDIRSGAGRPGRQRSMCVLTEVRIHSRAVRAVLSSLRWAGRPQTRSFCQRRGFFAAVPQTQAEKLRLRSDPFLVNLFRVVPALGGAFARRIGRAPTRAINRFACSALSEQARRHPCAAALTTRSRKLEGIDRFRSGSGTQRPTNL
jgi:hypothetical protein